MTTQTLAALTAVYNEAGTLLGEQPVKKLASKAEANKKVLKRLGGLKPNQQELCEPTGDVKPIRKSSAMVLIIDALSQDAGATIDELGNLLVRFYASKEQELKRPNVKARGMVNTLHKAKGLGYRRVGKRYWLVAA